MASRKTKTLADMMSSVINEKAGKKRAFHTKARAVLGALTNELDLEKADYDLRTNKGGPAVSGEVVLHTEQFYLQVSQSAGADDVLFRQCEGRGDFTGGENHWAQASELDDVSTFAERLSRELGLPGMAEDATVETERKDIPLGGLRRSPKNVRIVATDDEADRQLAANIQRRGLLQNLIVYKAKDGMHEVAGGGRRLAALNSLGLSDDHPIPCLVAPEALAVELSTAENLRRSSMHPADEAEAFRLMVDEQGRDIGDVAAEFGFSTRLVQQRLKLASLAPELLEKFRSGEISLEWAMALTLSQRHEEQLNAWKQVAHFPQWHDRSNAIKRILSQEKTAGDEPLAMFVGLAAYRAAGGSVDEDLFSSAEDAGSVYLTDTPLLNRLAHDKLEETAARLRDQWCWAEARVDFPERELWTSFRQDHGELPSLPDELAKEDQEAEKRIDELYEKTGFDEAEEKELELLEARRDQIEHWPVANARFSDDVRQCAGCIVTIDHAGNSLIHQGLIRPEDQPKDENAAAQASDAGVTPSPCTTTEASSKGADAPAGDDTAAEATDASPLKISEVLGRDLGAYRTLCLQAALAGKPDLARDLLLLILAKDVLHPGYWSKPSEISARAAHLTSSQSDLDGLPAVEEITAIRDKLPLSFTMFADKDQPAKLRHMPPDDKDALMAACVALSLTQRPARPDGQRNETLDFIQGELGGDQVISDRWRPTAANFFGRIRSADALAIGREILGEEWAQRHRKHKKDPLGQALEKAFAAGDDPVDGVTPEARAKAAAWLPPGVRLPELAEDDSQPDGEDVKDSLPDFLSEEGEGVTADAA